MRSHSRNRIGARVFVGGLATIVVSVATAAAGDFKSAHEAYEKGSYYLARQEAQKLAQQGNADAKMLLGLIYLNGNGVQKDPKAAFQWFLQAAAGGNQFSEWMVGTMYLNATGVRISEDEGYRWVSRAADHGLEQALDLRAQLEKGMTTAQIAEARSGRLTLSTARSQASSMSKKLPPPSGVGGAGTFSDTTIRFAGKPLVYNGPAFQLAQEYENNEVKADLDYRGKIVTVNGVVEEIGKTIGDTAYVVLASEPSDYRVQCLFSDKHLQRLGELKKGDSVTVRGECTGLAISIVVIYDCTLF